MTFTLDADAAMSSRRGKYDATFKNLIDPWFSSLRRLLGVEGWEPLPVEFPELFGKRVDALFHDQGNYHHIEFQTKPEAGMPLRMLEYLIHILMQYQELVLTAETKRSHIPVLTQTVLYVGTSPLKMDDNLATAGAGLTFKFDLIDIRSFDHKVPDMLRSLDPEDWILGVLCMRKKDPPIWDMIAERIGGVRLPDLEKVRLATQFLIAAILRDLGREKIMEYERGLKVISVAESDVLRTVFDTVYDDGLLEGALREARDLIFEICEDNEISVSNEEWERTRDLDLDDLRKLRRALPKSNSLGACLDLMQPRSRGFGMSHDD